MNRLSKFVLAGILAFQMPAVAEAQLAPTLSEILEYDGLFKAAHEGNLKELARFLSTGSNPDTRDGHGRTLLHVAAHASQENVMDALVEAGADVNASKQGYDKS